MTRSGGRGQCGRRVARTMMAQYWRWVSRFSCSTSEYRLRSVASRSVERANESEAIAPRAATSSALARVYTSLFRASCAAAAADASSAAALGAPLASAGMSPCLCGPVGVGTSIG